MCVCVCVCVYNGAWAQRNPLQMYELRPTSSIGGESWTCIFFILEGEQNNSNRQISTSVYKMPLFKRIIHLDVHPYTADHAT